MLEREKLRALFNQAAVLYHQARPEYPEALFDALVLAAGLGPESRLLEIGPGTGKATLALARRGFLVTGVEMGQDLARLARENLRPYPVRIVEARFEDFQPESPATRFDLMLAATAWHWIDPDVRWRKAWQLLKPGGHLAFWRAEHVFPDDGDPFFLELQEVYDEIGDSLPAGYRWPRPGQLLDESEDIKRSGFFQPVLVRQFDWETVYTADGYINLLNTFSGHLAMEPWQRDRLYGEIRRRMARRSEGTVRRHWGAALHVARRIDSPVAARARGCRRSRRDGG